MALEVSAAIIGILAAAGKVAETLGPVVSAFVDAPKHFQSILIEVRYTRTILLGLQLLFDELDTIPQQRRQLIKIDQLIAALTDGVLLFSELEALVHKLGDPNDAFMSRAKWAKKDHELESIVAKLLGFKTSATLMLGILRCESDLVAHSDRKLLLEHTANIIKNNENLSQKLAQLESRIDATRSTTTMRTASLAHDGPHEHVPGTTSRGDVTVRASMLSVDTAKVFQFEPVLTASRVYRKVKRDSSVYSFCSSAPPSHAWTDLSELSLDNISDISVIALPLERADIYNADRYEFLDLDLELAPDNTSQYSGSEGSTRTLKQTNALAFTTEDQSPYSQSVPDGSFHDRYPITKLRCIVMSAPEADANSLVTKFTNQSPVSSDNRYNINHYSKTYDVDYLNVHLAIEAVDASDDKSCPGLHADCFFRGDIFMFIYRSTSRASFDAIQSLIPDISLYKASSAGLPIMLICIHSDLPGTPALYTGEGHDFAKKWAIPFLVMSEIRMDFLNDAFRHLVRQKWAFESLHYHLPSLSPKLPAVKPVVAPKPRRFKFLRRPEAGQRRRTATQPELGAIQEV